MNKILGGVAAFAVLSVFSGVAVAQTEQPARSMRGAMTQPVSQADFVQGRVERLRAADSNNDGTVTVEEMRAAHQARRVAGRSAMFDRLDANKDGSISRAEFEAPRAQGQRADQRAERGHTGGMHRAGRSRGHERKTGPVVIAEAERKATEQFARLDSNGDGMLSVEERRTAMMARRSEMGQKHRHQRQSVPAASSSTPVSE